MGDGGVAGERDRSGEAPWSERQGGKPPARKDGRKPNHRRGPDRHGKGASRFERPPSFMENDEVWLWGLHAVAAALANPARRPSQLLVTRNAAHRLELDPEALPAFAALVEPRDLDRRLGDNAVHQGVALKAPPLAALEIDDVVLKPEAPLVILDQVTDPQNVGAVFRSAAAFGLGGVVMQTRNAPALGGALAKAAAGAIEHVAEIRAVNLSRAITALRDAGWVVVGLDGHTQTLLSDAFATTAPVAVVLGAEGAGLRPGVAEACSLLARIPMAPAMESLNVSNAAAIAFYETARRGKSESSAG
ncbi:MAG: RNA methyltransferase [Hyphomonadaceae bacterium]